MAFAIGVIPFPSTRLLRRRRGVGRVGHANQLAADGGEERGRRRRGADRVVEAEANHLLGAAPRHLDVKLVTLLLIKPEALLQLLLLELDVSSSRGINCRNGTNF